MQQKIDTQKLHKGVIIRINGPVVDIRFEEYKLPNLYDALFLTFQQRQIFFEVAQQIGNHTVRCLAMNPVLGLSRGLTV